jgi:pimeloyl-ACP methyl ester carboxylesterase
MLIVLLVLALVPVSVPVQGQSEPPPLSVVYEGTFTNADYQIVVPNPIENWNGTLLVYAHGYTFDLMPAFDERTLALAKDLAEQSGYAVAGSSFRNGGWAVKEGLQNTLALTNRFNGLIGKPQRTILWGDSMGSVIALKGIEKHPGIYDGAISGCGVGGGTPVATDLALDLALAYDVAFRDVTFDGVTYFGWPDHWGTVGDVWDDIDYETHVLPMLMPLMYVVANPPESTDPSYLQYLQIAARFEFIRLVLDLPLEDFYPDPNDPLNKPGGFLVDMAFATEARAEIEQRANGAVSQNLDHVYSLSPQELAAITVPGIDPNQWLLDMNVATTYEAERSARNYVEHYAAFTGDLQQPVLTLHTTIDPINPPFHEKLYAETVAAAGKSDLLLQLFTGVPPGHCEFTPAQRVKALAGMEYFLATDTWPPDTFFHDPDNHLDIGFIIGFTPPDPYYWPPEPAASAMGKAASGEAVAGATIYLPLTIR